jgi:hypothetical protein
MGSQQAGEQMTRTDAERAPRACTCTWANVPAPAGPMLAANSGGYQTSWHACSLTANSADYSIRIAYPVAKEYHQQLHNAIIRFAPGFGRWAHTRNPGKPSVSASVRIVAVASVELNVTQMGVGMLHIYLVLPLGHLSTCVASVGESVGGVHSAHGSNTIVLLSASACLLGRYTKYRPPSRLHKYASHLATNCGMGIPGVCNPSTFTRWTAV